MQTRKTSKPAGKNSLNLATNKKCKASTSAEHVCEQGHVPTDTTYDNSLQEQENISLHGHFNTIEQIQPKPIPSQNMYQKGVRQVTILSPNQELDSILQLDRQRVQPLLGYDWIAGLLDAESSLTEHTEQFFSELRTFRQVNKEECVHSQLSRLPGVGDPLNFPLEEEVTEQQHTPDIHQCTFCYRINSRLFATPLDPQAVCPICKMPKAKHPHTEKEPAFIRVSIPRSTLLPAYQYKAHRRCSFDPSDSLGLPSHCSSGWLNITQKAGSQMSSLDLRSCMEVKPDLDTVSSQQDLSVSRVSGSRRSDQLLDISRLARYRFQHLNTWRDKTNKRY
ncbi:migration and invasion-inhibitory protein isoform X2 [Trichomycterus rosablanca]